jgi:hypothetical protein
MMKSLMRIVVVVSMLWISQTAFADSFTFTTTPASGDVFGTAGSTVGWGYTITNESLTDWLFAANITADLFDQGTLNLLFDFPILAPGATASLAFDALAGLGLYELTWDATAPVGFSNSGVFTLSAEWWDGDPFAGGNFIDFATDQQAVYSATVTGDSGSTEVPEPSSVLLLSIGCMTVGLKMAKYRQKRQQID